jgi:hypothetical protein
LRGPSSLPVLSALSLAMIRRCRSMACEFASSCAFGDMVLVLVLLHCLKRATAMLRLLNGRELHACPTPGPFFITVGEGSSPMMDFPGVHVEHRCSMCSWKLEQADRWSHSAKTAANHKRRVAAQPDPVPPIEWPKLSIGAGISRSKYWTTSLMSFIRCSLPGEPPSHSLQPTVHFHLIVWPPKFHSIWTQRTRRQPRRRKGPRDKHKQRYSSLSAT